MAKTMGKGRKSDLRSTAESDTDLVETSDDDLRDQELVVAEEDGAETDEADVQDDANDEIDPTERALMASDQSLTGLRPATARARAIHIPEWMMGNALTRYAAESYVELRYNTTWPTARMAWNSTLIVIVMSIVVAIILGTADFGLVHLLTWFVSLGH